MKNERIDQIPAAVDVSMVMPEGIDPAADLAAFEIAKSPEAQVLRDALIAFYDKIRASGRSAEAVEYYFVRTENGVERAFGVMMAGDALGENMMLEAAKRSGHYAG